MHSKSCHISRKGLSRAEEPSATFEKVANGASDPDPADLARNVLLQRLSSARVQPKTAPHKPRHVSTCAAT